MLERPGPERQVSSMSAALAAPAAGVPARAARLEVGAALSASFAAWRARLLPFAAVNLIATVPLLAGGFALGVPLQGFAQPPGAAPPVELRGVVAGFAVFWIGAMLVVAVQVGALTSGVVQHLAGRPVAVRAMLGAGLRAFFPLVAVGAIAYALVVLGLLLLVVPGVVAALACSVVFPVVVAERPGVLAAFRRSFRLTKGNRLAILAVFAIFGAISLAVTSVSGFLVPAATASFAPWLGFGVSTLVNVVMGPLYWIVPAVLYHQLRVAKEGVDPAALAAVFE